MIQHLSKRLHYSLLYPFTAQIFAKNIEPLFTAMRREYSNSQITRSLETVFKQLHSRVDSERLLRNTSNLWQAELGQTFAHYHASAQLAEKLMRETGCQHIERIPFPADGKTVYQDKTMPMGWHASKGRLEITESSERFENPVVADYEIHPFHLIKGSVATPPEGIETRLIDEDALRAGADARGAFLLLNPEDRPFWPKFRLACDAGALGLVTDNLVGRHETPDAIPWVTACTEGRSWHTLADDRPFIGYTVSPYVGDQLRSALRKGDVKVRAFSDGKRSEDKIDVVTGVIPGSDEREVWLLAHLYEPLANDNSSGVACALEIAQALNALYADGSLPRPHFTLRLVLAMEAYGFAAYAEKRGGWLGDQVLCALNLDSVPIMDSDHLVAVGLSQSGCPSSGDSVLEELMLSGIIKTPVVSSIQTEGIYGDDRLLADSTIGVPTLWVRPDHPIPLPTTSGQLLWHNSEQTMSRIRAEVFHDITALYGTWTAAMLDAGPENIKERLSSSVRISCARLEDELALVLKIQEENDTTRRENRPSDWLNYRLEAECARLNDFLRFGAEAGELREARTVLSEMSQRLKSGIASQGPEPFEHQAWKLAESIVIRRKTRGLPQDLSAAPFGERSLRLGALASGPLALVLVHADGHRNVAELLLRAQWEEHCFYSPEQVLNCIGSLQYFAKHGYIELVCSRAVTKPTLIQALGEAGIREGDLLMVHSALSPLGVVEGGPDAVIDALFEVLGSEGTLLMPTFTRSFLCFGKGPARSRNLTPFHPDRGPITTGAIPDRFRKIPGATRSQHPTHSVAGIGPLTQACLSGHGATDAPTGSTSPWARLHELNGKIVFLGAHLSSCTFLHYLETVAEVDYLESAICVVDDKVRGRHLVTIPQNLPGKRDFYRSPAEDSKIFLRLVGDGLKITSIPIGFSELKVIDAAQFYRLGIEALKENPGILT